MLPSKGYFNDIECPYLENTCGRPYCHFNHRKKQEIVNEVTEEESTSNDFPTYKPTPKSELAIRKSHIPISYVPDVYKVEKTSRSFRNNIASEITYKPTPISLLNSAVTCSANNVNNSDVITNKSSSTTEVNSSESKYDLKTGMSNTTETKKLIHENIAKYEYKPGEQQTRYQYNPTSCEDINEEKNIAKYEYKPGEQETKYQYNPTSCEDINEESLSDIIYKPNSNSQNNLTKAEYTPSTCAKPITNINFENLDSEFNMIDEIINMSDTITNPKNHDNMTDSNIIYEPIGLNQCDMNSINSSSETESISHNNKNHSSRRGSLDSHVKSIHVKMQSTHKDRMSSSKNNSKKDRKDDKRGRIDDKKEKWEDKKRYKGEKVEIKKDRKDDKKNRKEEEKDKRSDKKERDCRKIESKKQDSSKSKEKDRKVIDKKDDQETSKDDKRNSDKKSKSKELIDKKETGKSHSSHRERDKTKHSKHKKDRHKHDKKDEKRNNSNESRKKGESSSDFELNKNKVDLAISSGKIEGIKGFPSMYYDFDEDIEMDTDQTMEECFKIFNEYKPTVEQVIEDESVSDKNNPESLEESAPTKKRIAHSNASNSLVKFQTPKPISKPSPGQIMTNRFKIIKAAQADNEVKLITNELRKSVKRPEPTPLIKPAKKIRVNEHKPVLPVTNTSLIDEILNKANSKLSFKKIAPVSNVMNMQRAKEKLKLISKQTTEQLTKTVAQTNKAGKRQAHVPDYSLSDIPDVIDVDKSKLPVNVRSRFLTLLADECCKLYLTQKEAYKRALDEEYSCYQKCKVLVTYRNSAMLAVNRLRKEVREREENNLGPIGSEESSNMKKGDAERKSLYNKILQYVLTNDELDIHGYPRESSTHGRAIIKNRKVSSVITLPKNQKKCCRCSKIYLIDDDGKAIYEEECLYHPLRKRTIRGEHIYLCCKSTDDSGCVTSHTHVCESPEDAELEGYQTTLPPNGDSDPRSNAVYALDCEMCYTTKGLELTRVTVIDTNCKTVYESFVKPLNEIIDYNTRFSGITKQQMDKTNTGILQVQANILHLCNSNTILIGHSLESDMKALKIIHNTIVDTAVLFPHKMGLPHKRALRTLASDYLKKIIQNDIGGHDSAEDAITCMELIKWKVKEDSKFKL